MSEVYKNITIFILVRQSNGFVHPFNLFIGFNFNEVGNDGVSGSVAHKIIEVAFSLFKKTVDKQTFCIYNKNRADANSSRI